MGKRRALLFPSVSLNNQPGEAIDSAHEEEEVEVEPSETLLYAFTPLPLLFVAVVLFAMGGYGTYLGFRIRFSNDVEEKANAKDLHPKLLGGMFFFFALGATGGITALLTSDKPIFESPHAVTGLIGLTLLTIQTILPSLFEGNPGLQNVHGILGSGIMTLFLVHAALGLQLGLSFEFLSPSLGLFTRNFIFFLN
ncbi:unnamed protein product [Camellia sinensis]